MNSKKAKRVKRRCKVLWNSEAGGFLQERYGVAGFDKFYKHAKKDVQSGNEDGLNLLEEYAKRLTVAAVFDSMTKEQLGELAEEEGCAVESAPGQKDGREDEQTT